MEMRKIDSPQERTAPFATTLLGIFVSSMLTSLVVLIFDFIHVHFFIHLLIVILTPVGFGVSFGCICRDWKIPLCSPFVSLVSMGVFAYAFPPSLLAPTTVFLNVAVRSFVSIPSILLSILALSLVSGEIALSRWHLKLVLSTGIVISMISFLTLFSSDIAVYLDNHPWVATFLAALATLVGGFIIGRWKNK